MDEQNDLQPTEPIQGSKNVWIITSVFVTALIVGSSVYAWQRFVLRSIEQSLQKKIVSLEKQLDNLKQGQQTLDSLSSQAKKSGTQVSDDKYEIVLKKNPQDNNKIDVYIKNLSNGTEKFFITLADVYSQHYHHSEYRDGNLYIIKRIEYDGYPDETWSDELWRYNAQKKGTKLYSSKGIDFRVAPNGEYIAVSDDRLRIIDQAGNILQTYRPANLGFENGQDLQIRLLGWSSDSSKFWGNLSFTAYPQVFFKIETDLWIANKYLWSVDKYDVSDLGLSGDYDLNENNGKIAYSNYPTLLDVNSAKDYKDSGTKVNLQVYDLKTKKKQQIAISIGKKFDPKWIDNNTLEYNDPNSDSRIQKIIE